MRMIGILLLALAMVFAYSMSAKAELKDRGGGLIYDTDLKITWYDYTYRGQTQGNQGVNWDQAMSWAASLTVGGAAAGTWRLPKNLPVNGSSYNCSYSTNGSTDCGLNITSPNSEMAYLYYVELGNKAYYDINGNPQPGGGLTNTGPFTNLQAVIYHSGTELGPDTAFSFAFYSGDQFTQPKSTDSFVAALAVHDGDVGNLSCASEIVLTAIDAESIDLFDGQGYGDNILRAYSDGTSHWDGFIKFDLSSIPDLSVIEAMTLTTYLAGAWGTPYNNPSVRIYRSADDSWYHGQPSGSPYPGLNEVLTDFHTDFPYNSNQITTNPAADLLPYDWELNINAVDWSVDLNDKVLSLAMHNEKPTDYCFVYFYGSNANPAPPTLKVRYCAVPEATPPKAICKDVTVGAGSNCTATASIDNGSYDPDGDTITSSQSPPGPYPLGNTSVTLTVTDSKGASSSCTGSVTVVDKTPPTIPVVSVSPSTLWPPNHKMVDVTVNYTGTDNCNPSPACGISSVTSNESISRSDYAIVDAHHVNLTADRLGSGNGRVYTITITCTDASGNSSSQSVIVTVPHDQGK